MRGLRCERKSHGICGSSVGVGVQYFLLKKKKKKKRETGDDVWMLHTFSKSAHPQGPYMVQR